MRKKTITVNNITLTSIFTALVFVATGLGFDPPMGGRIHMGNFVAIMTSLLFGPIVGAISGSLGMGLFNIFEGRGPETFIRTIIINFFLGLVVGFLYKFLLKKKSEGRINFSIYTLAFISGLIGMTINLILEFIFRIILSMIFLDLSFNGALITSATTVLTSSILRGVITVMILPVTYKYLYKALDNFDIIKEEDFDEEKTL